MQPSLRTRPWTFDETADLPGGLGLRYEVVDGALLINPPVTTAHQRAAVRLMLQLAPQLPPEWEVLVEAGVRLGTDGRRPDGALCRRNAEASWQQMGFDPAAMAMLFELVSPGSRKNDRFLKPVEYAEAGVPVYWRLEPDPQPRLHVLALRGTAYEQVQELTGRGRADLPFGLDVDLTVLGL